MNRSKQIIRTSVTGIVTNVMLAGFKALVGLLAHSVAIVLDAVNNLSDALIASGSDALFDAVITLATLVSAGIMLIWNVSLDGYLGALISIVIIKAGIEMLSSPINQLLGASVSVDVVPDITVSDDQAFINLLTDKLKPILKDTPITIVIDHNYTE